MFNWTCFFICDGSNSNHTQAKTIQKLKSYSVKYRPDKIKIRHEIVSNTNTVKLHRVFSAPPERVFKAFIDPDALVKWMAPHGFTAKVHHLDAQVGGTYKMSFRNFSTGSSHGFSGTYHELVPNQLLRYTDQFDDPNLSGQIEVMIQLKAVSVGTEVNITQSGIPDVIPVEACYLGWQESLQLLALLVNPEIPDQ